LILNELRYFNGRNGMRVEKNNLTRAQAHRFGCSAGKVLKSQETLLSVARLGSLPSASLWSIRPIHIPTVTPWATSDKRQINAHIESGRNYLHYQSR
jgi:hypothetical protein